MAIKEVKVRRKSIVWSEEQKDYIFHKTDGCCHLCGKKLARKNYAQKDERGCWEVEHSKSIANGGTDHLNNLFPACIPCNREKSNTKTSVQMRISKKIPPRVPPNASQKHKNKIQEAKRETDENHLTESAVFGSFVGSLLGGPVGAIVGGVVVGGIVKHVSNSSSSKKKKNNNLFDF
jgi:5-methylcytosine-specific restriction endonuclease McrA